MDRIPEDVKKHIIIPMLSESDKQQILYAKIQQYKQRKTQKEVFRELHALAMRYIKDKEFVRGFDELEAAVEAIGRCGIEDVTDEDRLKHFIYTHCEVMRYMKR